jgi:uncharacterized protein YaeQ
LWIYDLVGDAALTYICKSFDPGLKKLSRSALELLRRPDGRQGSYAQQMSEMMHLHDYLAENGLSFALGLHQMHDDLSELINNIERGRKHWKQFVLSSEKKVSDAEQQAEKVCLFGSKNNLWHA